MTNYTSRETYEFVSKQTGDPIVEWKTCKLCNANFPIYEGDIKLYDQLSPIINGKKYQIPTPTHCPECRQSRRLARRNERKLYNRKCDFSRKHIISIYSPDKPYIIYDQKIRRSDQRDPMNYGRDIDFSQPFFTQFDQLLKTVPLFSLSIVNAENCDYTNAIQDCQHCYMSFNLVNAQHLFYSNACFKCEDCCDTDYAIEGGSHLYWTMDISWCFNSTYLIASNFCSDSHYLYGCDNCKDCIMCYNLHHKQYCIENLQYAKEAYEKKKADYLANVSLSYFHSFILNAMRKSYTIINSENCIGNNIYNSEDVHFWFSVYSSQNVRYAQNMLKVADSIDCTEAGFDGFHLCECMGFMDVNNGVSVNASYHNNEVYYVHNCYNSHHLFGCIGLRYKQFCIFNKQYTEYERHQLVPKLIEKMQTDGEWGEFFPGWVSPFGYNESMAHEFFPLAKEDALYRRYKRQDHEYPINLPENAQMIQAKDLPRDMQEINDTDIVNKILICEMTGKPFRLVDAELKFYRQHGLPLPTKHPDQRHLERMQLRTPRQLRVRTCANCGKAIQTAYAPDRPEIVYCEECYQKEMYG